MPIAQFNGIDIPLIYSLRIRRAIIADEARTAGGTLRRDLVAVKSVWSMTTRPMLLADRDALIDHLDGIGWDAGDFWLDEFGPTTETVEVFLEIIDDRQLGYVNQRHVLDITATER